MQAHIVLAHIGAKTRVQFGRKLGEFELVQKKLARMAAWTYAMEAMTTVTAGLIDRGLEDCMLETAMLKVFVTDVLWRIVNDTIQIFGGKAYFTDEPFERMMRDARINMIGEGANDVLRNFIALVGMRDVGMELQGVLEAAKSPLGNFGKLAGFMARKVGSRFWCETCAQMCLPNAEPTRAPHAKPSKISQRRLRRLPYAKSLRKQT